MRLGEWRMKLAVLLAVMTSLVPLGARAEMRGGMQALDVRATVSLVGNVRPEVFSANDLGPVSDQFRLDHMQLLLKRSPQSEAALVRLIDQLHDPASPQFHHWLTARELGARFAPGQSSVRGVIAWLRANGFGVNQVQTSGMLIDFSGNAGQVRAAFGTEIHALDVNGVRHIANMSNPRIPAVFAGVINGIVSLHDFRPHTNNVARPAYTIAGNYGTEHAVVPADLATIYNFKPLFAAGITGKSQTITLIEDSDVFDVADWTSFRTTFGLSAYPLGSFKQIHPAPPSGVNNCSDPGVVEGNESEATLDADWSSAAAPNAAIVLAACADSATNFGGFFALQNLVNSSQPPAIVSISFGECEAENGASANQAYYALYQQAVAEGSSIYVATGDEGAASCDADVNVATHGIGVNGFASTPYNVAVGGTDFGDTSSNTTIEYWSTANSTYFGSALSYIPEIPWNDSCAGALLSAYAGYKTPYGIGGFCNSAEGRAFYLTTSAGSGGPSGCAYGDDFTPGVVNGNCRGYPKPSWQSLVGNPADGVRDLPDVSMFAANGIWGHFYIYCDSDRLDHGKACTGAPSTWAAGGGTSYATPIMAGVQALINQKLGAKQGNPNPVLYRIAADTKVGFGTVSSVGACFPRGAAPASVCAFQGIADGDNNVNCTGSVDCYLPGGKNGVLSKSASGYQAAYGTGGGWNFATGIGSVNAANLVQNW